METKEKETIEVPREILVGLYRIMCGIPYSLSGHEVYPEAIDGMKKAHKWVVNYGDENNIDSRGKNETHTTSSSHPFLKAREEVERIIKLSDDVDLKSELEKSSENVPAEAKHQYYRHMNALFLNVLLNRLDELGKNAEQRSIDSRKILVGLIDSLR